MRRRITACQLLVMACVAATVIAAGCGGGGGGALPFTIAGTVKNDSGSPIAGAQVTATIQGQASPIAATTTSSTGVFGFALPAATYVIEASASGFQSQQQLVTITASQPNLSVSLILTAIGPPPPPPANLGGIVIRASGGSAIVGATVTATLQGQSTPLETTITGSDGRYGFWLAGGTYVIAVSAVGYKPAQQTVTLPAGGTNLGVNFALTT